MRKSNLLAVAFLAATTTAHAEVTHSEVRSQLDILDHYHSHAMHCKLAVIDYHEEGMNTPACVALVDGLDVLEDMSQVVVAYTQSHASDPRAIPDALMDRLERSAIKAQGIADTINLLCGRMNWCNR